MEELSEDEARLVLRGARLGHLGLAHEGHAYVVPVFYAYDGRALYFHSLPGLKDAYIASTEEACMAVTRAVTQDLWESVLVFGPVEEVTQAQERLAAMDALMTVPPPPAMGTTPRGQPRRTGSGVRIWKLAPRRLSGRRSVPPEPAEAV